MTRKTGDSSGFDGFMPETVQFLNDLFHNNNKAWFERHKGDYIKYVLEPLADLVDALSKTMLTIDPMLETLPLVNKTISRIYRDVRFSRDKSPYRTTAWIVFKRACKDWQDTPAYFMEISPFSYRFGMGFYSASKTTMDKIRWEIDNHLETFVDAVSFCNQQQTFVVEGERYKRIINNRILEELLFWYQRKNLYLVCNRKIDETLFSPRIPDDLLTGFKELAPFYQYLWRMKNGVNL